jgi:hypothetical protein
LQLLVLAVVGAVVLGVVEEAAMLVVVYSLGEVLEAWVAHRARRSLHSLMDLVQPTARRRTAAGVERTPADARAAPRSAPAGIVSDASRQSAAFSAGRPPSKKEHRTAGTHGKDDAAPGSKSARRIACTMRE